MGDFQLIWHFVAGALFGLAILAILSYFPGADDDERERVLLKSPRNASDNALRRMQNESNSIGLSEEVGSRTSKSHSDCIPVEELEQLRKKFRLTNAQMERVIEASRKGETIDQHCDPKFIFNSLVYAAACVVFVYFVNRDYDDVVTRRFVQTFPEASRRLGLVDPE